MSRILTGIQSSGKPHLGNLLGAIVPAIHLSQNDKNDSYFFIADFHSLTSIKDPEVRIQNTQAVAASWLAFGFDTQKNTFYRQSKIPEVTELTWYLNCFTQYPMLANAHSFKDKADRLSDVNAGLFTYPVLMAADILLYDANIVPIGKDQKQHLEMAADIANSFNHYYQKEVFVIPEPRFAEESMLIPGVDGKKMSKSYNNYIDIFLPEKELKKVVYSIMTDDTPLESPKDPDKSLVFKLYSLLAQPEQIEQMRKNYLSGGYGYGHAKGELLGLILEKYKEERIKFNHYMKNLDELEHKLEEGEAKARLVAYEVLSRIRRVMGF
jgi:tryptophanyl-tRNA synthetase